MHVQERYRRGKVVSLGSASSTYDSAMDETPLILEDLMKNM
jgi:hypothetical protein